METQELGRRGPIAENLQRLQALLEVLPTVSQTDERVAEVTRLL